MQTLHTLIHLYYPLLSCTVDAPPMAQHSMTDTKSERSWDMKESDVGIITGPLSEDAIKGEGVNKAYELKSGLSRLI